MKLLLFIATLGICCLTPVFSSLAAEKSWHMSQERYACYTSGMTLQELASGGVTVLSHTPPTKQYCDDAHRWGLKVCPYVSLYKVIDSTKADLVEDGMSTFTSPFWKELDASKHTEWFLRREDGEIRRPFDETNYHACLQQSCCNHRSLIEAYVQGVRNVMDLGAAGVFVDNVHPYPECFGAKLRLHTHDWPEKNNVECYKMALRRVYNTVKSYGQDRVVILNPGGPSTDYVSYGDTMMWESFIWRSAFDGDKPPLIKTRRWEPRSWNDLLEACRRWQPWIKKGASIAPLTYLPERTAEAENAFFAYAAARLAGFDQWTGTCTERRDILRRLYRIETGKPISEIMEADGAAYRLFQNALIVCNHSKQTAMVRVPLPSAMRGAAVELYDVRELPIAEGQVLLTLPAESGRVIVSQADAISNLLRELDGQALAARLHLEEKKPGQKESNTTTLRQQLHDLETRAASHRKSVQETTFPTNGDRQTLAKLSQDAAAVRTPAASNPFLTERLDNLRRHAGLLLGLMAK